ncbi:hypothetical protein EB796_006993 [Bugula neritina]|uniref:Uncharacterized protein n=1 Tax=Bugula neritina TaxID=10212 RepID=A0A7J7K7U2_BUGNE|nr:hypothetical protein EB796_006993 [Bugula neritina]
MAGMKQYNEFLQAYLAANSGLPKTESIHKCTRKVEHCKKRSDGCNSSGTLIPLRHMVSIMFMIFLSLDNNDTLNNLGS